MVFLLSHILVHLLLKCVAIDAVVETELVDALQVSVFPEILFTKAGKILFRDKGIALYYPQNILKRKEICVSHHFFALFLLTLLNFHLVVSQTFALQKSGQKSWLTFTMEQLNHPV